MVSLFHIVNIILYLVSIALFVSIPDEVILLSSVVLSAVLLTLGLALYHRKQLIAFSKTNWFLKFSSSVISVFLIFLILGLINYLSYKHPVYVDLTKMNNNSLTEQSKKVIKAVKGQVKFTIFARKANLNNIRTLFELYRLEKPDIKIIPVDAALRPDLLKMYSLTRVPSILIEANNKKEIVYLTRELEVTNALIKISRKTDPSLCFTTDHGELNLLNNSASGGSVLRKFLESATYNIFQVSTLKASIINKTCKVLSIFGPKSDFLPREIKMLESFIKRGGNLLVAIDPMINSDKVPRLRKFLIDYGILINNNFVIDINNSVNGSNGTVPLIYDFEKKHSLTPYLVGPVFFPLVSSISQVKNSKYFGEFSPLVKSLKGSWGENNLKEMATLKYKYDDLIDNAGPLNLMVAVDLIQSKNRIIALGNSSFASNSYSKYNNNYKLFLNSVSWLDNQGTLMSFDRAAISDSPVFIGRPQVGIIFYFSVLLFPILLMLTAVYFYRRRLKL